MIYIDIPPPIYYQPQVVIERPIYYRSDPIIIEQPEIIEEPVYIQAYPTVRYRRTIQTETGTIIIDRGRDRIYSEEDNW